MNCKYSIRGRRSSSWRPIIWLWAHNILTPASLYPHLRFATSQFILHQKHITGKHRAQMVTEAQMISRNVSSKLARDKDDGHPLDSFCFINQAAEHGFWINVHSSLWYNFQLYFYRDWRVLLTNSQLVWVRTVFLVYNIPQTSYHLHHIKC